jgi:hypothetical protein
MSLARKEAANMVRHTLLLVVALAACTSGPRYMGTDPDAGDDGGMRDADPGAPDAPTPDASTPDAPDAPDGGGMLPSDWVFRAGSTGADRGKAATVDADGNVIAVGVFNGSITLGGGTLTASAADGWVAKYDPTGVHLWSARIGGSSGDSALGVAVDSEGDVYVTGIFQGTVNFGGGNVTASMTDAFLLKLDGATGGYEWVRTIGGSGQDRGDFVVVDGVNVYWLGRFTGTVNLGSGNVTPGGGEDQFLVAVSTANAFSWAKGLTTSGTLDMAGGVAAADGDVIVAARYSGTATLGGSTLTAQSAAVYMARFDGGTGAHVWSAGYGGDMSAEAKDLAACGSTLFFAGNYAGTSNFGGNNLPPADGFDAVLAAYSVSNGAHVWSRAIGNTGSIGDEIAHAISCDASKLTASIRFTGSVMIESQTYTATSSSTDTLLVNMALSDGTPSTVLRFGGTGYDLLNAERRDGRLVGTGEFQGGTSLFGTSLNSDGTEADIVIFAAVF